MTRVTPDLLSRFDVPGPRYTSYPTADRFVEAFTADDYARALRLRRAAAQTLPLSVYVHIPFCESLCYYCACNKIITKRHERGAAYLQYLEREMALHTAELGSSRVVSQLHLGGGSPTFLSDAELGQLMQMLRRHFTLAPGGEYAIEVDPRTVDPVRLAALAALGFNRLSFGVQDFDADVQKAVHRVQPAEQVFALVEAARALGFESINTDLIYGLPRQTPTSFARTLEQVVALRPDRIALYATAHLGDPLRVGGGEQQGLAALGRIADDLIDVFAKAHVQHAICFIQHQRLQAGQLQGALLQMLENAARGADGDVGLSLIHI